MLVLGITDEGTDVMLSEKKLKLEGAGKSINVALGQRLGWRPCGRPSEPANRSAQPQRGVGECRYCGTPHRQGWVLCSAFGNSCRLCGTEDHFAKVCMKDGQYVS